MFFGITPCEVWDHTMVLFTRGENIKRTIEDYITSNKLDDLIKQCQNSYHVCHTNRKHDTEALENQHRQNSITDKNIYYSGESH